MRQELDAWEQADGSRCSSPDSARTTTSRSTSSTERGSDSTVDQLAWLLTLIVPVPVMILAANRRSTGIGVRPRGDRIEITADFTPDAPLMIATATVIVSASIREVIAWPSYEISALEESHIPVIKGFRPMPHTTRKGWLARYDCYPENAFACDIDQNDRHNNGRGFSLRDMAGLIANTSGRTSAATRSVHARA